jgi:hypothetical protein
VDKSIKKANYKGTFAPPISVAAKINVFKTMARIEPLQITVPPHCCAS